MRSNLRWNKFYKMKTKKRKSCLRWAESETLLHKKSAILTIKPCSTTKTWLSSRLTRQKIKEKTSCWIQWIQSTNLHLRSMNYWQKCWVLRIKWDCQLMKSSGMKYQNSKIWDIWSKIIWHLSNTNCCNKEKLSGCKFIKLYTFQSLSKI